MNLKKETTEWRIVFSEIVSIHLLVGLATGFAWGGNDVCLGLHDDSTIYLSDVERTYNKSHPEKEFVTRHALSQNLASEKSLMSASVTDEGFDENQVGWIRIIRIVLMGTVIGGMLFLGRCL